MYFKQIFDRKLAQYSYLIGCQQSGEAIVIDPLRDVDQYFDLAAEENLELVAAADTHIHADYVSGLRELAEKGLKVYASDEGDSDWKYEWLIGSDYNFELIRHGDRFKLGNIRFEVLHTPGHTPESVSFLVVDGAATDEPMGIITGDFVFVGDVGRPDLLETAAGVKGVMEPSARTLYRSLEEFRKLPDYLQIWPGHGAGSACGKSLGAVPDSTVGYERITNPALQAATSEDEFVSYILDGQPEPPLYFARMKAWNRDGAPVLGSLPRPVRVSPDRIPQGEDILVIDTRTADEYAKGHLKGSMLAMFGHKQFNTIAGSYADPDQKIYLVIGEENVEDAVRDLIRVGLDHIEGYIVPEDVEQHPDRVVLEAIDFSQAVELSKESSGEVQVVDVRNSYEHRAGHLPDSINIAHTRLADQIDSLPKEKTLVVHCALGPRAIHAAALLDSRGYDVKWVNDEIKNADSDLVR